MHFTFTQVLREEVSRLAWNLGQYNEISFSHTDFTSESLKTGKYFISKTDISQTKLHAKMVIELGFTWVQLQALIKYVQIIQFAGRKLFPIMCEYIVLSIMYII